MTAKQLLMKYVDTLTEDEAEETMLWLAPKADRELSSAERSTIERGLEDARRGRLTALEEIEADLDEG